MFTGEKKLLANTENRPVVFHKAQPTSTYQRTNVLDSAAQENVCIN